MSKLTNKLRNAGLNTLGVGLMGLALGIPATAEEPTERKVNYVQINGLTAASGNLGFSPGVGGEMEFNLRKRNFGIHLEGGLTNEEKLGANSGYRYFSHIGARLFPKKELFLEAGIGRAGYISRFPNGVEWSKRSNSLSLGAGVELEHVEVLFKHYFREHTTPNEVSADVLRVAFPVLKRKKLVVMSGFKLGAVRYNQYNPEKEREERRLGVNLNAYIGLRFKFPF